MARKKGGFNRFLEFIGLVDDNEPRDTYGDEYSADNYGRRDAYTPQHDRAKARPQSSAATRRSTVVPTRQTSRESYSGRFASNTSNASGSLSRTNRYDYTPRPTAARFGGTESSAGETVPQKKQPNRAPSRTIMYTLHALEDCPEVIDTLIRSDTVVLTLDNMDAAVKQRVIDTLSGAVFALQATIRRASESTYLIAPKSVEVGDTFDAREREIPRMYRNGEL